MKERDRGRIFGEFAAKIDLSGILLKMALECSDRLNLGGAASLSHMNSRTRIPSDAVTSGNNVFKM